MNNFDDLMKNFRDDAKGLNNIKLAMLVMEYSKKIEENYSEDEKSIIMEQLINSMNGEDVEKAKKYVNLLKN